MAEDTKEEQRQDQTAEFTEDFEIDEDYIRRRLEELLAAEEENLKALEEIDQDLVVILGEQHDSDQQLDENLRRTINAYNQIRNISSKLRDGTIVSIRYSISGLEQFLEIMEQVEPTLNTVIENDITQLASTLPVVGTPVKAVTQIAKLVKKAKHPANRLISGLKTIHDFIQPTQDQTALSVGAVSTVQRPEPDVMQPRRENRERRDAVSMGATDNLESRRKQSSKASLSGPTPNDAGLTIGAALSGSISDQTRLAGGAASVGSGSASHSERYTEESSKGNKSPKSPQR